MVLADNTKGFIGGAVEYWTKQDSFSDAGDALIWGITNPVKVTEAVINSDIKGAVKKDLNDAGEIIDTAAMAGTLNLVKAVAVVGVLYVVFGAFISYSNKKAEKMAL